MADSLTSKRMTDRELLRSCMEAMHIAHRVQGARTDWSMMIEDIRRHLESSAHETTSAPSAAGGLASAPSHEGEAPAAVGAVSVVTNEAGECIAVTRTDSEHQVLSVIWERRAVEPSRCTCPGGTPNSALGWHSACPLHGIKAQQEKDSAPPCGNPVMINSDRYRGCRLPSGHEGECSPQNGGADQ